MAKLLEIKMNLHVIISHQHTKNMAEYSSLRNQITKKRINFQFNNTLK